MKICKPSVFSTLFLATSIWAAWEAIQPGIHGAVGILSAVCFFAAVGFGIRAID